MPAPDATALDWTGRLADPALEREYQRESFDQTTRRFTQVSLGASTLSMLGYAAHDLLLLPPSTLRPALAVRLAVFAPVGAALVALTFTRAYARWQQAVGLAFGVSCNATVVAIATLAPPALHVLYASYAVLFTTLGPFIARLGVRAQLAYTALAVALYAVAGNDFMAQEPRVWGAILGTTVALGSFGAVVAREQEAQARARFLQGREVREKSAALAAERALSERLLLNVLPARVAVRLKAEERPIADGYGDVTVVFADVVGFTAMSARLEPSEVVRRLDAFFTACDALAREHGLEKIKTIGDAYMAVGGLDERSREGHPRRVVAFALGLLDAVEDFNRDHGEDLAIRVGVHTGPVVAGVIGTSKFAYDVWGDTVNTASRMESHGVVGAVQVSEATWLRAKGDYAFEPRGEIDVKGKGVMRAFVLRRG